MANDCWCLSQVGCELRKLRNWHSLVAVINALQSPKVYAMEEAWMAVKKLFPVHLRYDCYH